MGNTVKPLPSFLKLEGATYVCDISVRFDITMNREDFAFQVMRILPSRKRIVVCHAEVSNEKSWYRYYCSKISKFYGCSAQGTIDQESKAFEQKSRYRDYDYQQEFMEVNPHQDQEDIVEKLRRAQQRRRGGR